MMKNIIIIIALALTTTISLFSLEPVSLIVDHNTGEGLSVQLVDYGNPESITTVYTEDLPDTNPNSSGLIPFIIGSGVQSWSNIAANSVTSFYVINVLDNTDKIIAQYRLDGLINSSAKAGIIGGNLKVGGDIVLNGFLSQSNAGTFTDSESLSSLKGNIFIYNGDSPDDEVIINADDLNPNIPDYTILYIVNDSRPDAPDSSDVVVLQSFENEEMTLPIFPTTAFGIMKIDDRLFPIMTFPFFGF